jgi:TfoX/Sxy family transcriptional regulator of competence genes
MASSRSYLEFVLEQLSDLDDISYKPMMGEFIIYYQGKIVGGIYDDRFLVKDIEAARKMMPDAELQYPYEGAKKMLVVDNVDNREFLKELFKAMVIELPAVRKR